MSRQKHSHPSIANGIEDGTPCEPMTLQGSFDAPTGSALTALRIQMHQLEMTMNYGGPSEICGAIDAVESALHELRELVTRNEKGQP